MPADPLGSLNDGNSYIGDVPHPGYFIREELEARGWSQRDLAYILGVPEQAVNMIISGKRAISPEMAKALGEAFDVDPDLFANLQLGAASAPPSKIANRLAYYLLRGGRLYGDRRRRREGPGGTR